MSELHNIDSHKLIYHPARVAQWLEGRHCWDSAKSVYPLYVEIAPIGACNHRCTFCSVDYIGYRRRSLDPGMLRARLGEMAALGVKSVMFAGEGEPTLWKELPALLDHCTAVGIDTSLTTNMVPFTERNTGLFVRNCRWIKTSINAGSAPTYAAVHRTRPEDFDRVLRNFERAVRTRAAEGSRCTIGGQILLLPENAHEVTALAATLRDIGVDYLVVKPYTQSLYGLSHTYQGVDYQPYLHLEEELATLATEQFRVVFRRRTMDKLREGQRLYRTCRATPFFWAYVMADGSLYGCSAYLGNDRFCYGNLHDHDFRSLWESAERRRSWDYVRTELDIRECRVNCRMDDINRYLWQFDHPDPHVNFI